MTALSSPPLSRDKLALLLETFWWPAALVDPQGEVWAKNSLWEGAVPGSAGQKRPLGDGWMLELRRQADTAPLPPIEAALPLPDSLTALTRGLTHELRNPLSAILTAIELLQDVPGLDEENAMLLGVVRSESRRIGHILNEFSAYARPPVSAPIAFDFALTVRHAVAELSRELERDGLTLKIRDDLPPTAWVMADEAKTYDALSRVLHNARDAMRAKGDKGKCVLSLSVEMSDFEGKPYMTLCIEDSGAGFGPESSRRAFEPFFSTKPSEAGLGLSIARGALEVMEGKLWIETPSEGTGARVCFSLPTAGPHPILAQNLLP